MATLEVTSSGHVKPGPEMTLTTLGATGDAGARIGLHRRLVVVCTPGSPAGRPGLDLSLGDLPVQLGRPPHVPAPLALDDREVSKLHATLGLRADGLIWIKDEGSRNGTFVGGARITETPLPHGAVIRVGRTVLLYLEEPNAGAAAEAPPDGALQGPSLPMRLVRAEILMVAPRAVPVLVLGETGTGKELVAAALHAASGRRGRLVPVNCAALPESLAESELFGHARGAFSGANTAKEGLFAAARGGTLFLDEVGEMPAPLQAKVLRALATGEVRPVGSNEPTKVELRVVAATHRDLSRAVDEGGFRADLLARLAGWTLRIPPLRERTEDVVPLAELFLARLAPGTVLAADAVEALLLHDWPFNVRGLERAMEYASVKSGGAPVRREHLPREVTAAQVEPVAAPVPAAIDRPAVPAARATAPSRDELLGVIRRCEGNLEEVARHYGKDRRQIYRWMERWGLSPEEARRA